MGEDHSCGLCVDGAVRCWGDNSWNQLPLPPGAYVALAVDDDCACALGDPPEQLQTQGFVDLDVGHEHACAITVDQRVYCWPPSPTAVPEALAIR